MPNCASYDVYVNGRKELLVVPGGTGIPPNLPGAWRRRKRATRTVSEAIREDVRCRGYHFRRPDAKPMVITAPSGQG